MKNKYNLLLTVILVLCFHAEPAEAATIQSIVNCVAQNRPSTQALDSYQEYLIGNQWNPDPLNVQEVSDSANYRDEMRGLYIDSANGNKWTPTQGHLNARNYINGELQSLLGSGNVKTETITNSNYFNAANIIGELAGTNPNGSVIIIGAHYDATAQHSIESQRYNCGGSDNGSGVAAVLEAARVLSQFKFENTIRFVLFDAEEPRSGWAVGSAEYASSHRDDNISGMISVDMIGYNHEKNNIAQVCIDTSLTGDAKLMAEAFSCDLCFAVNTYTTLAAEAANSYGSDHKNFDNFTPAGMLIEEISGPTSPTNPYYHELADFVIDKDYDFSLAIDEDHLQVLEDGTTPYIDLEYATEMTKAVVAWAAIEASPIPEPTMIGLFSIGVFALFTKRRRYATHLYGNSQT